MSGTMPPTPDTPSAATGRGLTPKEYGESLRRSFHPGSQKKNTSADGACRPMARRLAENTMTRDMRTGIHMGGDPAGKIGKCPHAHRGGVHPGPCHTDRRA